MNGEQWEVSALERLIREGADEDIQRFLLLLRPPEIADVLEHVGEEDRIRVLRVMSAGLAADVLRVVEEPEREEILDDLSAREISVIVHESRSDDAADIIGALSDAKAKDTLERLDREEREELEKLLKYGEETAGGIMQRELVTVRSDADVAQALHAVRAADMEEVGDIHEVFVVDREGHLVGTVSPTDLLHAAPKAPLRTVLEPNPVSVPLTMDQERIAEVAREHDLAAIPVVDESNVLVGQVLHDDVADVIEEEATEDIARMAGTDPDELYEDSVGFSVKSRAPWLVPAFIGGLLVAFFLGGFEDTLGNLPIIAMFLPVILGMSGGVGMQAATVTVRGLALGRIEPADYVGVAARQIVTGVTLGAVYGLVLLLFVLLFKQDEVLAYKFAMALGLSLSAAMTVGATMGVIVPLSLHRLGFDPAIATSPFVQTANDLTGAGIILLLVYWMGLA